MDLVDVKSIAKRSKFLHSSFKLVRDGRTVPAEIMLNLPKMCDIFRVLPSTMVPIPVLSDAYDAVVQLNAEDIEGVVVECGVWNGGCSGLMALANARFPGPARRFHLFDSFQGMPQPTSRDTSVLDNFRVDFPGMPLQDEGNGDLVAIGACVGGTQYEVERFLFENLGLDHREFVFHPGWFQDTVPEAVKSIDKIALLRLDGDWYESTTTCIAGLFGKVVPRGYVIIDDYGDFPGCRQAIDEHFSKIDFVTDLKYSGRNCVYFRMP